MIRTMIWPRSTASADSMAVRAGRAFHVLGLTLGLAVLLFGGLWLLGLASEARENYFAQFEPGRLRYSMPWEIAKLLFMAAVPAAIGRALRYILAGE